MDNEIPDYSQPLQVPNWALGDSDNKQTLSSLHEIVVPEITRNMLVNQLYLELMDKKSKNQAARVRAAEVIAKLKGFIDQGPNPDDDLPEDTSNVTTDEAATVAKAFGESY